MPVKKPKKQVHYLKDDPRAKYHQPRLIVWSIPNVLGGRKYTPDMKYLINHYYFES